MMTTVYGIPNCSSVKKVRTFLEEQQIAYDFIDFKKHAPDETLIRAWLQQISLEKLLNKRGTTWRKLDETTQAQAQTEAGAIALMIANPSVIKRPVLAHQEKFYVGVEEAIQALSYSEVK